MSIRQLPSARWTVPGTSGGIAANWYVYTYQPGTSTPKSTYTDYTGAVANSNPTVLDARGEANIWWDGTYKVIVYTGDKDNGGVLVWSQDNYGEGNSSVLQGNFNLCLNGSFEQDTNGDGDPDNWTIVRYTGGIVARDSTDQAHGLYSLKFTSVGTGGGYATSDYFEVEGGKVVPVSFATKASVATVHNQVDIVWYTSAKAVISTTTLYNDQATNPTSWTDKSYATTAPATARFAVIRLFGCKSDVAQAGSAWFDIAQVEVASYVQSWVTTTFPNVTTPVTATSAFLNSPAGRYIGTQVFSTTGAHTYTATTGTQFVIVEAVGGGGGGAGASASAGVGMVSTGGGSGAYAKVLISSGFSGVTVTIGAAGAGGATPSSGGTTSFGTFVSCPGGTVGVGGASTAGSAVTLGGAGGVAPTIAGATTLISKLGEDGENGILLSGSGAIFSKSHGGESAMGVTTFANGSSGHGAGGNGGAIANVLGTVLGTAGTNGQVIVYEYS